ncbi:MULTISPECIES: type I polyketide synthase [Micromonospora]|uniref:SDR family NAD(P)-dependent oxidoreductase n=1 Tax=Micromonospora solifontis TaxID=2487138 RepID=A0ABX9WHV6_9ACTN|nr:MULTISPECIES: type I polyketide synthase [Micromonospora]NES15978.1 SDR family NAD(P)-dependent oxidoreductase [Micromonospora sp. PPF5-17B]NES36601.1 SDR family NAD(P)-dependent oxidoreductase [Micromonospora solifontis]NES57351.1 SDR family NAD(P)-dependent oxidoreductase [Micromonospora sp. PPF5-6]RNL99339.1 SDR family NAD(P)-dependent oxidoreductase [Micromonospora solifontis]
MQNHIPGTDDGVEPIAIVGLAARVPGADDVNEFWRNLVDGVESSTELTREEQIARGARPEEVDDPGWVNRAPLIDGYDKFDAGLFGMTTGEAEMTDPQHRLFLEACYVALQDGGYDPGRYDGAVGVYAGTGSNVYLHKFVLANKRFGGVHGGVSIATSNSPNYVATNVSYRLDLRGPSLTVHTACSTSLVAFHLACEALRNGECDMALAGGVNVELPHVGYLGMEGFTSPDGRCRPFDAGANGTVWGSGVGVTLLKRLSDAVADGDTIRAVVLGNAINNDGAGKVGFTAPSIDGQTEAIAQAVGMAGIDPRTISYVEAHGTGTALGDPIEVAALTAVYTANTEDRGWCGIGSVKSNIGHLSQPSGIVGVIKTVLAMEHGLIPPTINYETPNPAIEFADTPFYVTNTLTKWDTDGGPRRAGVSSFGIGGTNAHVVLEEAPAAYRGERRVRPAHLLQVSAKTPTALDAAVRRLADHLDNGDGGGAELLGSAGGGAGLLADVAHTLRVGRQEYPHRAAVVATDPAMAAAALRDARKGHRGAADGPAPKVAFLFSGQGSQYAGMGAQLYAEDPGFAAIVDECAELLRPELGLDIRDLILGRDPDAGEKLTETRYTQPALFTVEYALASAWRRAGVIPVAMIGHSIGEYVAATLAGVLSLPDALRVVATRGRLMHSLPAGSMLAVSLDESAVADRLPDGLSVATVNGPGTCVVAGETALVEEFAAGLKGKTKKLRTSHAFHSPMMEPILAEFTALMASVPLRAPAVPFLSNVTGTWITAAQATDPAYWAAHLRRPVRFGACVATLLAEGTWALVECGPGRQLANLARMQVAKASEAQRKLTPLGSLPGPGESTGDLATLLGSAGALWCAGVPVRPAADPDARRVPLPAYPFERRRYWIDPDPVEPVAAPVETGPRPLPEWFAVPVWRQAAPARGVAPLGRCLVLADGPRGTALVAALRAAGDDPVEVRAGDAFAATATGFRLRPGVREDHDALVAAFGADLPRRIVHAYALDGEPAGTDIAATWAAQDRGFFSALHLVQALAGAGLTADERGIAVDLVTAGIGDVRGDDLVRPEHATLAGLSRVLPVELPGLTVRLVDADPTARGVAALVTELRGPVDPAHPEVALRRDRRWVAGYEQVTVDAESEPGTLREEGRYLITGGLGGIGVTLAEDFARRVRAKLVLLARSGLPERDRWDEHLAVHGGADRAGRAIAAIRRMEAAGAEVLVLAADVTDLTDLRRVREAVEARFGGLDGIVHAAGLPGGGMAEVKERAEAERVLAPKLAGTLALAQVFGDLPLDFVALCSSITAVIGGFGQVDYCAANNFLDALARTGKGFRAPVVSQNWGGWAEVGMAVETNAPAAFRAAGRNTVTGPVDHPVLTTKVAGPAGTVLHGLVSAGTHWLLDEHRIGGVPVVPGTAHLESVRAAVVAALPAPGPAAAVELRDVVFLEPFSVPDGTVAQYRVELAPTEDGVDFTVASLAAGRLRTHVRGAAGWTGEPAPPAAEPTVAGRRVDDDASFGRGRTSMLTFGPRWAALAEHHLGDGEELARVEAPAAALGDLPAWGLHPALLDVATAFGRGQGSGTYLPLSYGRIVVRGTLPAVFHSHLRHRDAATDEVVAADLSLVDPEGRELVAISDFVLRRVDQGAVTGGLADAPAAGAETGPAPVTEDIRPVDGAEAFRRSLSAGLGAQVVITTRTVADIRRRAARVTTDSLAAEAEPAVSAPATTRSGSAAPATELEQTIAQVWRDGLGVAEVGVDDDFFALGGNSLVAVQLIAAMRKATGVRLPMRSLFETPTVAGLAARIEELRAAQPAGEASAPAAVPAIPRLPRA